MARVLCAGEFPSWLAAFLPGLATGSPASLFTPAIVSDSSDGQIAHLHGLNLSRTWCFRRKNCCLCCPKCDLLPNTLPCWTVDRYRDAVVKGIKALIAAKYSRYCWNARFMKWDADAKLLKEACEKACKTRRDRFIAEAEEAKDCPPPVPGQIA